MSLQIYPSAVVEKSPPPASAARWRPGLPRRRRCGAAARSPCGGSPAAAAGVGVVGAGVCGSPACPFWPLLCLPGSRKFGSRRGSREPAPVRHYAPPAKGVTGIMAAGRAAGHESARRAHREPAPERQQVPERVVGPAMARGTSLAMVVDRSAITRERSARRLRDPGSTRSPSRAREWPCLRGCAGARSRPGRYQTAFEAWGKP
jgi:hypothetical protein